MRKGLLLLVVAVLVVVAAAPAAQSITSIDKPDRETGGSTIRILK